MLKMRDRGIRFMPCAQRRLSRSRSEQQRCSHLACALHQSVPHTHSSIDPDDATIGDLLRAAFCIQKRKSKVELIDGKNRDYGVSIVDMKSNKALQVFAMDKRLNSTAKPGDTERKEALVALLNAAQMMEPEAASELKKEFDKPDKKGDIMYGGVFDKSDLISLLIPPKYY